MKENTNIILYAPGAYGNFINWCCSYFSGLTSDISVPFTELGCVHSVFPGLKHLLFPIQLKEYLESTEESPFAQLHENSVNFYDDTIEERKFLDVLPETLTFLSANFKKIIYVYPTNDSILWILHNQYYKINPLRDYPLRDFGSYGITDPESYLHDKLGMAKKFIEIYKFNKIEDKLKFLFSEELSDENLSKWGNKPMDTFQNWELRELASWYFYDRHCTQLLNQDIINKLQKDFLNIHFVRLDDLRDNFSNCLIDILKYFDIKDVNNEDIKKIEDQWRIKQNYILKDIQIQNILDHMVTNTDLDWEGYNLTFLDEVFIQRRLRDIGIEIKCWNLNKFPTNTKDSLPLLEKA